MPPAPIPPGSAIGVLGTGQLGRMFGIAARRMGYRVHAYSPDRDTPAGQIADVEVAAPYEDLEAVRAFARDVRVVTFEFENVPAETVAAVTDLVPVRPSWSVLEVTQHRVREKGFLTSIGVAVPRYAEVESAESLAAAVEAIGCPSVLKTSRFGYDGKGQARIKTPDEAAAAWASIGSRPAILEEFVDFECELSIVSARAVDGTFTSYDVVTNVHRHHILDVTRAPADVSPEVKREAMTVARAILEGLDVVGVLCVELFLTKRGRLLVNELAPRPHNSGHYTVDANVTSQFEQQLRAVCGLPLGSPRQLAPAAMVNLLGDLWEDGEPRWERACELPDVKLHLYGKTEPRPGRKMGHLTALARTVEEAATMALAARNALHQT